MNRLLSIQSHTGLLSSVPPNQNCRQSYHDCHATSFPDPWIFKKSLLCCFICGSKPEHLSLLRKIIRLKPKRQTIARRKATISTEHCCLLFFSKYSFRASSSPYSSYLASRLQLPRPFAPRGEAKAHYYKWRHIRRQNPPYTSHHTLLQVVKTCSVFFILALFSTCRFVLPPFLHSCLSPSPRLFLSPSLSLSLCVSVCLCVCVCVFRFI